MSELEVIFEGEVECSITDTASAFLSVITLWREKCHTINRRIAASVQVPEDSPSYRKVIEAIGRYEQFCVKKLITKSKMFSQECYEYSILSSNRASFHSVVFDGGKHPHVAVPYEFELVESPRGTHLLRILSVGPCPWLVTVVAPALLRWFAGLDASRSTTIVTNSLIDKEQYNTRYQKIKEEWGRSLVEAWTENTDPHKFVYEDCAIASYLSELWKGGGPKKFLDIGCGNGLLVYLLDRCGFKGAGVDIRSRDIWTGLLAGTELWERTIDPRGELPEGVDYLVGNHSDEMTPWIPIMAARLSCDFFLLPCCPFDFYGKFSLRSKNESTYSRYMHFIRDICVRLGYDVQEDRLAIPSTKRCCFVCRVPPGGIPSNVNQIIEELTTPRHGKILTFRPKTEKVVNCSSIDRTIREEITTRVFTYLLEKGDVGKGWRKGGEAPLNTLIPLLSYQEKLLMKQQNGGFQTFLKNQHQVFKVMGGIVRIRDWREENRAPTGKEKTSACWMNTHHPDGCPLSDQLCSFRHS